MATFPFTFPHAGQTFSVVTDGAAARDSLEEVYVRIVGIRGLHEFGPARPGESNGRLRDRICRWYDATYVGPAAGRAGELDDA